MLRISSINVHNAKRLHAKIAAVGDTCWLVLSDPAGGPEVTFFFDPAERPYFERLAAAINGAADA